MITILRGAFGLRGCLGLGILYWVRGGCIFEFSGDTLLFYFVVSSIIFSLEILSEVEVGRVYYAFDDGFSWDGFGFLCIFVSRSLLSRRYCGSYVDFPHPVSPVIIIKSFSKTKSVIFDLNS